MQTQDAALTGGKSSSSQIIDPLIQDFLEWLAAGPKPYSEVMETWRTSCPRLTVWEDSVDAGLVIREARQGGAFVRLTPAGAQRLAIAAGA